MAINFWYRGVAFVRDYTMRWLTSLFYAIDKGAIVPTDGTRKIEFSRRPTVIQAGSWTAQDLPAILIGDTMGKFSERTFTKNLIKNEGNDDDGEYRHVGGDMDLSTDLMIRARTTPERNDLLDIACIYLTHPDAKDYFQKQGIILPEPPSIGGSSEVYEGEGDFPLQQTNVSFSTHSTWTERSLLPARLLDIIVEIEAELFDD